MDRNGQKTSSERAANFLAAAYSLRWPLLICCVLTVKGDMKHVRLREHRRSDNGKPTFVVTWRPERGLVRRRTFNDRSKAEEEANYIEEMYSNGLRAVARIPLKTMTGIAFMLQEIPDVPIIDIIQSYRQQHNLNGLSKIYADTAATEFLESRNDPDRRISERHKETLKQHLRRFTRHFRSRPVHTIRAEELADYLKTEVGGSPRTRWNHAITLSAFGKWMRVDKKWFPLGARNAFEEIKKPKCLKGDREIYTPEELMRLLVFSPKNMLPFMTLGAFSGMRAAERERLELKHWQADNAQFALTPDITKTQRRRIVGAEPNLLKWIKLAGTETPFSPHKRTATVAKAAGVRWKPNALRSSFASYHLQKYKNASLTAHIDGHSVQELETSYKGINGVNDKSAGEWFSITPQKVIKFAKSKRLPQPVWG